MWYVIVFTQEDSVSVVPASWYVEISGECFWPPTKIKRQALEKLIKNKELPEEDWKPFKAQLLGKYEDYKQALSKVHKAYNKDKLSTTDDNENVGRGKRKKRTSYKNYHLSSSEADESSSSETSLSFPKFIADGPRHSQAQDNHMNFEAKSSQKQLHSGSICSQPKDSRSVMEKENHQENRTGKKRSRSLEDYRTPQLQNCLEQRREDERTSFRSKLQLFPNRSTRTPELDDLSSERNLNLHQNILSQELQKESATVNSPIGKSVQVLGILQKMQADASEFRVQVLRKLNMLNIKINDVQTSIENLKDNHIQQVDENVDEEFIGLFPLDIEKLNNLENRLLNEAEMKKMIKYLGRVGGSDVSEIVKRLMYKLLTNEVGNIFSWDGAKGKKKFKGLKLASVILNTVRANQQTKDATEADIIVHIKKWLVRSKDRINNLEKKQARRNENRTEEEDENVE